jgi:hypothetical protein
MSKLSAPAVRPGGGGVAGQPLKEECFAGVHHIPTLQSGSLRERVARGQILYFWVNKRVKKRASGVRGLQHL